MKTLTSFFTLLFSIVAYGAVPLGFVPYAQLDTNDFGVTVAGHINTRLGVHTPSTPGDTWYLTINGTNINNGGTNFLQSMNPTAGYLPVRGSATNFEDSVFQSIHGNGIVGNNGSSAARTTNFLYIPYGLGTPVGVPTTEGGRAALYFDATGDLLYAWNPPTGWHIIGTNIWYGTNNFTINPTDWKVGYRISTNEMGDTGMHPTNVNDMVFDGAVYLTTAAYDQYQFTNVDGMLYIRNQPRITNAVLSQVITLDGLAYNFPTAHDRAGSVLMDYDNAGTLTWSGSITNPLYNIYLSNVWVNGTMASGVNPTRWKVPYNADGTNFLDTGMHPTNTVDMVFDGRIIFGPGDTNWLGRVGSSLIYSNNAASGSPVSIIVENGSAEQAQFGTDQNGYAFLRADSGKWIKLGVNGDVQDYMFTPNAFYSVDGQQALGSATNNWAELRLGTNNLWGSYTDDGTQLLRNGSPIAAAINSTDNFIPSRLDASTFTNSPLEVLGLGVISPSIGLRSEYVVDGTNVVSYIRFSGVDAVIDNYANHQDLALNLAVRTVGNQNLYLGVQGTNVWYVNSTSGNWESYKDGGVSIGEYLAGRPYSLYLTEGVHLGDNDDVISSDGAGAPLWNGSAWPGGSGGDTNWTQSAGVITAGTNIVVIGDSSEITNHITMLYFPGAQTGLSISDGLDTIVIEADGAGVDIGSGITLNNNSITPFVRTGTDITTRTAGDSLTISGALTVTNSAPLTTPALEVFGGERHASFYTVTNYTASITNYSITLGAACTNTLMSAVSVGEGFWLHVKALAGGGEVWVQNGDFMDNVTNLVLAPWSARSFKSDGTNTWEIH